MEALKLLENGVTVRATQPKEYYVDNQLHELNGKEYWVVLSKKELKQRIEWHFDEIPVTTFITDMVQLFGYCRDSVRYPREELCLPTWDTANVSDMYEMFRGCKKFNDDISCWDVSKVRCVIRMFSGCKKFNRDLSNWKVGDNDWNEGLAFYYLGVFVQCDLSMFEGCDSLQYYHSWSTKYDVRNVYKDSLIGYFMPRKQKTIDHVAKLKQELLARAWHPDRVVDWCLTTDEKDEWL